MQHDTKSLKRDTVHNLCISMSDEHMYKMLSYYYV